jgi:hypothetical protein
MTLKATPKTMVAKRKRKNTTIRAGRIMVNVIERNLRDLIGRRNVAENTMTRILQEVWTMTIDLHQIAMIENEHRENPPMQSPTDDGVKMTAGVYRKEEEVRSVLVVLNPDMKEVERGKGGVAAVAAKANEVSSVKRF